MPGAMRVSNATTERPRGGAFDHRMPVIGPNIGYAAMAIGRGCIQVASAEDDDRARLNLGLDAWKGRRAAGPPMCSSEVSGSAAKMSTNDGRGEDLHGVARHDGPFLLDTARAADHQPRSREHPATGA